MTLGLNLWLITIFNLLIAVLHIGFWKLFNWKNQLERVSKENKSILEVLNILSIYLLIFFSVVLIYFGTPLLDSVIAKIYIANMAGFWIIRYILDFFYFDLKKLSGKLFNIFLLFGVYIHVNILF